MRQFLQGWAVQHYRADIDGLRALAVIPVILFHANIDGFGGGYVGVDVFFVISGFLITGFILAEIRDDKFTIWNFYERRIRRILPALFTMMLVCWLVASWLFLPEDFSDFGDSAIAATLFVSNFYFWQQPSYFAPTVELLPLLHTWSIAIEEQFYILYPILLLTLFRFIGDRIVHVIVFFLVISLMLSVWATEFHSHAAFYLAPSRAWELLLGAALAFGVLPQSRDSRICNAATILGVLLILWSVFLYSRSTPFPGLAALIPSLGTVLIIYGGTGCTTVVSRLLSLKPIVFIGLISYSLYLWHWPVLVMFRYYQSVNELSPLTKAIALVVAAVLAVLSWCYVERPFRDRRVITRRAIATISGVAVAFTLTLGVITVAFEGLPQRFDDASINLAAAGQDVSKAAHQCILQGVPENVRQGRLCEIGNTSVTPPSFILWGDSHAAMFVPAINKAAKRAGRSGLLVGAATCPPLIGVTSPSGVRKHSCTEFNQATKHTILTSDSVESVILSARWALYAEGTPYSIEVRHPHFITDSLSSASSFSENKSVFVRGLRRTLTAMKKAGKRIVIIGPTPEIGWDVPRTLALQQHTGRQWYISPRYEEFLERQAFVISTLVAVADEFGADIIWPQELLCGQDFCSVVRDGHVLYSDSNHISLAGANLLNQIFDPIFHQVMYP